MNSVNQLLMFPCQPTYYITIPYYIDLTYLCIMAPVEEVLTSQNLLAPVYQLYPLGHSNKVHKYEKRSGKKHFKAKNDFKGIELDNKGRSIAILDTPQSDVNDKVHDDDEIELSRSEQWERLNELLLLITTILIFNAFSLLIAILQITSPDNGTTFIKRLHSQKTIGISVFLMPNIFLLLE